VTCQLYNGIESDVAGVVSAAAAAAESDVDGAGGGIAAECF